MNLTLDQAQREETMRQLRGLQRVQNKYVHGAPDKAKSSEDAKSAVQSVLGKNMAAKDGGHFAVYAQFTFDVQGGEDLNNR